jgi:ABC-type Mn2+/Zn2+ transport system ATPase subunit
MRSQSILQLRQLTVRFGTKTVLDNIDVDIKSGEFVGVIGQNGAGKTTLLRVILGLLKPNHGEILIHGKVVRKVNRLIGYVPQKIHLDPDTPLRGRDLVQQLQLASNASRVASEFLCFGAYFPILFTVATVAVYSIKSAPSSESGGGIIWDNGF